MDSKVGKFRGGGHKPSRRSCCQMLAFVQPRGQIYRDPPRCALLPRALKSDSPREKHGGKDVSATGGHCFHTLTGNEDVQHNCSFVDDTMRLKTTSRNVWMRTFTISSLYVTLSMCRNIYLCEHGIWKKCCSDGTFTVDFLDSWISELALPSGDSCTGILFVPTSL